MTLTAKEVASIRAKMEEDHRRAAAKLAEEQRLDLEAFERLARFMPQETATERRVTPPTAERAQYRVSMHANMPLIDAVFVVFSTFFAATFTSREIYETLENSGFAFDGGKKQSMATISTALGKLTERKKILLVHQGSGRDPNVYQYAHKPQEVMEIEIT